MKFSYYSFHYIQHFEKKEGLLANEQPFLLYAEHVRQLGGASPLHNAMDVK
jgi:hypothetical protein